MANLPEKLPIAIVGGGITGLTAAYHLSRQGHAVRLFEASPRLGGNIRTERDPSGWLLEAGPNSIQLTPEVAGLLAKLGLTPLNASPAAKNRYVVRNGRPLPVPASPPAFLTSPLFSASAKLRRFGDLFTRRRTRTDDVSLADFASVFRPSGKPNAPTAPSSAPKSPPPKPNAPAANLPALPPSSVSPTDSKPSPALSPPACPPGASN